MITTHSMFPLNLYRTLFPGFVSTSNGEVYISQSHFSFLEIDQAISQLPVGIFGKYICEHNSPEKAKKENIRDLHFHIGVKPAWAEGYKKALGILQNSVLKKPEVFFSGNLKLIEITIVVTQNVLVQGTGVENIVRSNATADLSKQVALVGMKVLLLKMSPVTGAAMIHKELSECLALSPISQMMARMWMNLLLQVGGERSVMIPDKKTYIESAEGAVEAFETYLVEVIDWNQKHKIFAEM